MPEEPSPPKPPAEAKWSFGAEGDYAVDRGARIQWIAALAVVGLWVLLVFLKSGAGQSIRTFAGFVIPLAAIRWPDAVGRLRMSRGAWQPEGWPRPGQRWVRAVAWVWLLFPVWLWIIGMAYRAAAE